MKNKNKDRKGYSIIELAIGIILIPLLLGGAYIIASITIDAISSEQCGINDVLKESCAGKVIVSKK